MESDKIHWSRKGEAMRERGREGEGGEGGLVSGASVWETS